jgi:hypothetical protein
MAIDEVPGGAGNTFITFSSPDGRQTACPAACGNEDIPCRFVKGCPTAFAALDAVSVLSL